MGERVAYLMAGVFSWHGVNTPSTDLGLGGIKLTIWAGLRGGSKRGKPGDADGSVDRQPSHSRVGIVP